MTGVAGLDVVVLVAYLLGVTVWGAWLGRGQRGASDYFLGSRNLPWWAVMLSVVATETSTLTFLSIPGVAYLGTLTFLQLTAGYLVGRVVVAAVLLPAYARGELSTAYQLLEGRFGTGTRRFTSGIFMVTRLLADSVRLFATAIPLALLTGWPYTASIAVIGALTLVYTYFGGIRAVVWVDAAQMGLYLLGAVAAAVALQGVVPGGGRRSSRGPVKPASSSCSTCPPTRRCPTRSGPDWWVAPSCPWRRTARTNSSCSGCSPAVTWPLPARRWWARAWP
jgi:solute:Na+ symporter, SSS family